MINVDEALDILKNNPGNFGVEKIPLSESVGRVLKEEWSTDRDLPPYHRVTMDGIAVRYEDYQSGIRTFPIEKIAAAGDPQKELISKGSCIEVMTGSILPKACDTVIRYEDLKIENKTASVLVDTVNELQNIHTKGKDISAKSILIKEGVKLSTAEIAICASVGKANVLASKLPEVAIISTGNELVDLDEVVLPHQIRKSNSYMINAQLQQWNIKATAYHLNDDLDEIKNQLKKILTDYDVVLITGGVSKGKFDYLPQALDELGVQKHFHKIAQRPGKPFWFGSNTDAVVFALPGNPVSTFVCLLRYFKPWLQTHLQQNVEVETFYPLSEDVNFKPNLTYFVPVKLINLDGQNKTAKPYSGNGSGDFVNLKNVDGFLELPQGKDVYAKGSYFKFINFRK